MSKNNQIQDTDLVSLLDRGDVVSPDVLNVRGFKNPQTDRKQTEHEMSSIIYRFD